MGSVPLNTHLPHPARVYDYLLGGKDNFQADRDMARKLLEASPGLAVSARLNRQFMVRVARYLAAELGMRQFLDIGTGLPTSPNLHEVVQAVDPTARVVYVDNDPIVLTHARALLTSTPEGRTAYVDADLRDTEAILASPALTGTLDLDRPVAVSLLAILHFLTDVEQARRCVDSLVRRLVPGSVLAVSVGTVESSCEIERLQATSNASGIPVRARTRAEVEDLFAGLDLVDPGLVQIHRWWPDGPPEVPDQQVLLYGGVAVKR